MQELVAEAPLGLAEIALGEKLASGHQQGQKHSRDHDREVGQQPVMALVEDKQPEPDRDRDHQHGRGSTRALLDGHPGVRFRRRLRCAGHGEHGDRDHPQRVHRIPALIAGMQT